MKVLAVIPARGGSKGIPRKNIRFMCGKPLIAYAINNAKASSLIDDCVVTTDDEEIADIARCYGAMVVKRHAELAQDDVTLDPVVYDAVQQMEKSNGHKYDIVITLQPTSPLLSQKTLNKAIEKFYEQKLDTIISVVNMPHLSWKEENGKMFPNYKMRLNRQQLPPNYMETGAFLITQRKYVTKTSRLGNIISVSEVPPNESIDIDSVNDWIVSESLLKKKNIIFRVDGMKELGMGHIYNCLTMAFNMIEHNVLFITRKDCLEGIAKIKSTNMPCMEIKSNNLKEIETIIDEFKPDIWVNDCLDTNEEYIKWLKERVHRVVTIEDLGLGAKYADAVINALYENKEYQLGKVYIGAKYMCLRDEFQIAHPKEFSRKVKNIFVMFGGTDPSNLNRKLYDAAFIITESYPELVFNFVTGIGYDANEHEMHSDKKRHINVFNNISKVTNYMKEADLAVTSQGRTIFEIASMGIPSIVLAQNSREQQHTFATMKNGFINLGLGCKVSTDAIVNTLKWLIDTPNIRQNMRDLMLKHDFRNGINRIKEIVIGDKNE